MTGVRPAIEQDSASRVANTEYLMRESDQLADAGNPAGTDTVEALRCAVIAVAEAVLALTHAIKESR